MTKEILQSSLETSISLCELMKEHTSKIIKKAESQIPAYTQLFSDVYREYLHVIDDFFGTCYISEKEFFDKLNINPNYLKVLNEYLDSFTNMYNSQIDISTDFLRNYSQVRISMIKNYDSYMHIMMDSYARMLATFNSSDEK